MRNQEARTGYGFYGRLSAVFPSQIIIDATELCNLACVHCAHPAFKRSEYYAGRSLSPDLNRKAVDEVGSAGRGICQYIRYTGEGEPLLNPHLFEMLSYAVANSNTTVTLTTNGTLGQGDKLERLMATGVHLVDVSIDAFEDTTYRKIRVKGDLGVTRANVKKMIDMSRAPGSKTRVVVSYIEQPQNEHETADFERYWKDQGAHYVVIRRLHSNAGALGDVAEAMRDDNALEKRRPCLYPWERIILNPRGNLAFCPADWTHGSTIVDYRTTTIADTWRSDFYRRLREAHLTNEFSCHRFCGQCPDWKATRWPEEGRSYADMVQEFKGSE